MCVVVFAFNVHPNFPLILLNGRDMELNRPTSETKLEIDNGIICGRDLEKGGSWLGWNTKKGIFSVVTNYSEDPNSTLKSRGVLLENILLGKSISDHKPEEYNGFNTVCFTSLFDDNIEATFTTNRSSEFPSERQKFFGTKITQGIISFSNGYFEKEWPKVKFLKLELEKVIKKYEEETEINTDSLFFKDLVSILDSSPCFPFDPVSQIQVRKDLDEEYYHKISGNVFHEGFENYGTRSQTIFVVNKKKTGSLFCRKTDKGIRTQWIQWSIGKPTTQSEK